MKRIIIASLLVLALLLCAACGQKAQTQTTTAANVTFTLTVTYENGSVKEFTVNTDKATVGAALSAEGLIKKGANGVYSIVDGIIADYDVDQSYWAFYVNGDYSMRGLDDTVIDPDSAYEFVFTRE